MTLAGWIDCRAYVRSIGVVALATRLPEAAGIQDQGERRYAELARALDQAGRPSSMLVLDPEPVDTMALHALCRSPMGVALAFYLASLVTVSHATTCIDGFFPRLNGAWWRTRSRR
jgi:hypothetical protein